MHAFGATRKADQVHNKALLDLKLWNIHVRRPRFREGRFAQIARDHNVCANALHTVDIHSASVERCNNLVYNRKTKPSSSTKWVFLGKWLEQLFVKKRS